MPDIDFLSGRSKKGGEDKKKPKTIKWSQPAKEKKNEAVPAAGKAGKKEAEKNEQSPLVHLLSFFNGGGSDDGKKDINLLREEVLKAIAEKETERKTEFAEETGKRSAVDSFKSFFFGKKKSESGKAKPAESGENIAVDFGGAMKAEVAKTVKPSAKEMAAKPLLPKADRIKKITGLSAVEPAYAPQFLEKLRMAVNKPKVEAGGKTEPVEFQIKSEVKIAADGLSERLKKWLAGYRARREEAAKKKAETDRLKAKEREERQAEKRKLEAAAKLEMERKKAAEESRKEEVKKEELRKKEELKKEEAKRAVEEEKKKTAAAALIPDSKSAAPKEAAEKKIAPLPAMENPPAKKEGELPAKPETPGKVADKNSLPNIEAAVMPTRDAGKELETPKKWKKPDTLKTNLIEGEVSTFFSWKESLNYIYVFFGLAAIGIGLSYAGFYFLAKNKEVVRLETNSAAVARLEAEKKTLETAMEKSEKLGRKAELADELLKKHVYWTNFFKFIEEVTLPEVGYGETFSGSTDGEYSLAAKTKNFVIMAEQIKQFRANPKIDKVDYSGVQPSLAVKGVNFNLNLKIKPEIFYDEKNQQ